MGKSKSKTPGNGSKPPPPTAPAGAGGGDPEKPERLNQKDRWDLCRQVIEHEDNLVNHRLTWFLVINGFLMTACGASLGTLATAAPTRFQWGVVAFLAANCLLGLVISLLATPAILGAYRHVGVLDSWWSLSEKMAKEYKLADYPPLIGAVDDSQSPYGKLEPDRNPYRLDNRFWDYHRKRSKEKVRGFWHFEGAERYPALFAMFWVLGFLAIAGWVILQKSGPQELDSPMSITLKKGIGGYVMEVANPDREVADSVIRLIQSGAVLEALSNGSTPRPATQPVTITTPRLPAKVTNSP
jgi:hypothetical protein